MNQGKRVLVLGAQGLLGMSLVPFLKRKGYNVLSNERSGGVNRCDLAEETDAIAVFEKAAPDVIVNLAALTDVDRCEREPAAAYRNNVRVVENVVRWIAEARPDCYFLQMSTDQVYDGSGPHTESDVSPSNFYAFSKYAAELAAASVPSTVVRTNFFGPSACSGRMTLSDWVIKSLREKTPIVGFADVQFSPLSIRRLLEALEMIIAAPQEGVFNVGSREGMSKADFALAVAEVFSLPTSRISRGTSEDARLSAYRPKDMRMNCARFESAFGVVLPTLIDEIKALKEA